MNTVESLRDHLFATLASLQDKKNPMDVNRARAVGDVAQVIINSAKAEIDLIKAVGGTGSQFFGATGDFPAQTGRVTTQETQRGTKRVEQLSAGTITTHRAR